jgi:hypothetical protein
MARLSDKLNSLQFTPKPQSPAFAGAVVNVPLAQVSKYQEKNYFLCDGSEYSETTYDQLFAACGTQYNTGGETAGFFRVPNGPRETQWVLDTITHDGGSEAASPMSRVRARQEVSGDWVLDIQFTVELTATDNSLVATIPGVTFDSRTYGADYVYAFSGGTANAGNNIDVICDSSNTVRMRINTAMTRQGFNGTIPLASKPTDSFVTGDSRFSTFDEALQFQPMIKVYDDASNISMSLADATATKTGAIRLDSGFAAGDGVYGLLTANKTQRKNLTSDFGSSTGVMTDLTFNNLVIGKLYYVVFNPLYVFGVADASTTLTIKNGVTNIGIMRFGSSTSGATFANSYVTDSFIANATDITFTVGSSNGSYHGDNSINETHAILIEDNQTIKTTDFT